MTAFFEYAEGNSIIHKLNPLTKIIIAIAICASCFINSNHFFLIGMILLNISIAFIAGIGSRAIGILNGLLKISLFIFLLNLIFSVGDTVWISLPLGIKITKEGLLKSLLIVLRLIGATMPLAVMLLVTKMNDLSNVVVRKLHVPYKYAFAFFTAVRVIPSFSDEMRGIIEAQTARGIEFDTKNPIKKMQMIIPLCVPLLISTVDRTDDSAISAELRGFELRKRTSSYKTYPMVLIDYCGVVLSILIITAAVVL